MATVLVLLDQVRRKTAGCASDRSAAVDGVAVAVQELDVPPQENQRFIKVDAMGNHHQDLQFTSKGRGMFRYARKAVSVP